MLGPLLPFRSSKAILGCSEEFILRLFLHCAAMGLATITEEADLLNAVVFEMFLDSPRNTDRQGHI